MVIDGQRKIIGEMVVTRDVEVYGAIKFYQNAAGGWPGHFDCCLTLRVIKTHALRILLFYANRRRLTRSYGDWSSDVCSSDLRSRAAARSIDPGLFPGWSFRCCGMA